MAFGNIRVYACFFWSTGHSLSQTCMFISRFYQPKKEKEKVNLDPVFKGAEVFSTVLPYLDLYIPFLFSRDSISWRSMSCKYLYTLGEVASCFDDIGKGQGELSEREAMHFYGGIFKANNGNEENTTL